MLRIPVRFVSECGHRCMLGSRSHRGVLALDAGGVEAHGGDALDLPLDAEHALVVLLARLRLGEVPSAQRDGAHHPGRDQDVRVGEDLRTTLQPQTEGGAVKTEGSSSPRGTTRQKDVFLFPDSSSEVLPDVDIQNDLRRSSPPPYEMVHLSGSDPETCSD